MRCLMELEFTVPCVPCAQPRQRHRALMIGGRVVTQNYTPKNAPVNSFKATVAMAFARAMLEQDQLGHWPVQEGPIAVTLLLFFPRPKRLIWKKRPMPRAPMYSRPDAENCAKSTLDALTKLAWNDDAQVSYLAIEKAYCAGDESPRVEVKIQTMQDWVMERRQTEIVLEDI